MATLCTQCGNAIDVRKFCPACGADQGARSEPPADDPLIGKTLGDRYHIIELVNVGGMGRVYRGRQRPLDRPVAVKVIHRHLLTADGIAARFLAEAQAASRLNHPNVVSIFDFGQTPAIEGGMLYLVMELLEGRDLCGELVRGAPMPPKRLASIFQQILAALGEAHHLGIIHRDVKPDNVLLEPTRSGEDRVKVIDFGIAKVAGDRSLTQAGRVVGTPEYLPPELHRGAAATPGSDLYAVGVMLFQALTGQFPFYGSPDEILAEQLGRVRPDPRLVAPDRNIGAALAQTTLRALEPDPARRFPDAEAFAEAIVRAATSRSWSRADASLFPPRTPSSQPTAATPSRALTLPAMAPMPTPPRGFESGESTALLGRGTELASARDLLDDPRVSMLQIWGRTGTGRTRLLHEVARVAERMGARTVVCAADPHPYSELGYGALVRIVRGLADTVVSAEGLGDRFAAVAVLRTAAESAARRAERGVVLLVDDLDSLDRPSIIALRDLLGGEPVHDFKVISTSERLLAMGAGYAFHERKLLGLTPGDAAKILGNDPRLPREGDVEPLLVEQLGRCPPDAALPTPATLRAVVEWRIESLPPAERRVLQALGLTGGSPAAALASTLASPADIGDALAGLRAGGFVEEHPERVVATHAIFGRVALAMAPLGAVTELSSRAAEELEGRRDLVELRAHHAIRGEPDFGAYLLSEEAARLREARGDHEGAIAVLRDAVEAARRQVARGDEMGETAWSMFGQKLGSSLLGAGRLDEAHGVLKEVLDVPTLDDRGRVVVLEQLISIAETRDRGEEAEQHRRAAITLAKRLGDDERLRQLLSKPPGRERRERSA